VGCLFLIAAETLYPICLVAGLSDYLGGAGSSNSSNSGLLAGSFNISDLFGQMSTTADGGTYFGAGSGNSIDLCQSSGHLMIRMLLFSLLAGVVLSTTVQATHIRSHRVVV
jgi:hypothetical protein